MTTKDKVLVMMHKAAAARSLNDKIMAKRAEYRSMPSEAYLEGFRKAAEYYGVDPVELVKAAGLGDMWNGAVDGVKQMGKNMWGGVKSIAGGIGSGVKGSVNGMKAVGQGMWNGAKQIGQGLAPSMVPQQPVPGPASGIGLVGRSIASMRAPAAPQQPQMPQQ